MKFLILALLFLPVIALAQSLQSRLDSMHLAVHTAKDDTSRMNAYSQLMSFYDDVNLDSSLYYSDKAIKIARQLQLRYTEVTFHARRSWPMMKQGDYPRALKMLNMAMDFFSNPENEKYITNTPAGEKPRKTFLKGQVYIYGAFSALYGHVGNYEKSLSSSKEGIRLAELIKDSVQLEHAYSNLSVAYFNLNTMDSALYFAEKAVDYFLVGSSRKYLASTYNGMGEIQVKKGDVELAKENFQKAIQAGKLYRNQVQIGEAYLNLAALYQSLDKVDTALDKSKKALTILKLSGKERSMAIAYRIISDCYLNLGHQDSSFYYLQKSVSLKDKLDKEEKEKIKQFQAAGLDEMMRLQLLEKDKIQTQSKIRTYGLLTIVIVLSGIGFILYRNNRQKQKANKVLESTLANLKSTQLQLIQSEKMASLGELTAGIAHEIQNPLNFVNNFSEVSNELIKEIQDIRHKTKDERDEKLEDEILNDISSNLVKINQHGKRADAIVKGMLQHSRTSSGQKELTDINALCDEYLRLAYHGLRAKDKSFNAKFETDFDPSLPKINVIPQDVGRVILNLINNAFYAVNERLRQSRLLSGQSDSGFEPLVKVITKNLGDKIEIRVIDNGNGIPDAIKEKIFQPFFTTKPTGQGTGLGLSLSYDIVKAHNGELKVETQEGEGTMFRVIILK